MDALVNEIEFLQVDADLFKVEIKEANKVYIIFIKENF